MKILNICFSIMAISLGSIATAQAKSNKILAIEEPSGNLTCPARQGDTEEDSEKVVAIISQQRNCTSALAAFDKCALGNTYNLAEQTAALLEVCKASIRKDRPEINKSYMTSMGFCSVESLPGGERSAIGMENYCLREVTRAFNILATLNNVL